MEQTTFNGFAIMIFHGYNGTQLFITNPDGINIYAPFEIMTVNRVGSGKRFVN